MGKESLLCGVNGAWEFQALRLWGVNKCFRERFEQEHQYTGTSFSVPWRDRHHYERWKLILTTGRRIHVLFVHHSGSDVGSLFWLSIAV